MKLVSVAEMIRIEKAADAAGHSYAMMMENAGRGLAEEIQRRYSLLQSKVVTALVGSGNNGGDALVALDYLADWGWICSALLLRERGKVDPLLARVIEKGCQVAEYDQPGEIPGSVADLVLGSSILIDGILGTGIKLPIKPPLDQKIGLIKGLLEKAQTRPRVVAVDCPSGLDCDTGEVAPVTIPAELTVTMAAVKQGLLKFPAYDYLGELVVVGIGLSPELPALVEIKREVIQPDQVIKNLPKRPINAHKGTFGTCLIIAGSDAYPGAALLAGKSAYRIGSGLVTMAVPAGIYEGLIQTFPEATWIQLREAEGGIASAAVDQVSKALGRPTACLVGPGFGTRQETGNFLRDLIQTENLPPLVLDADALRLLAEVKNWWKELKVEAVLTPHPGEMGVLTGMPVHEIEVDRVGIAERCAREWGKIVLLKGAHTVIASPAGRTRILIAAEPALAKAGSGDVLAGIITGLIAQGMKPFEAAAAGAWIHFRAGQLAADISGSPASVLAGDISASIGRVLAGE